MMAPSRPPFRRSFSLTILRDSPNRWAEWRSYDLVTGISSRFPYSSIRRINHSGNNQYEVFDITYRPDIDGLRAIAIGSVFLFHLQPAWMPGGFVGVDIFFVISGYLITSILMRDMRHGSIHLRTFYQRRISRLFPTMMIVVSAVLLAAWMLYTPQDFASAGINSVAALLSLANVKFFFQGDYFQLSPDSQPLLHFWSLSVEEQYYIFYPLLLMALARFRTSTVGAVVAAISLFSFLACGLMTFANPKAAFYLLPFRAWELGLGGTIAIFAHRFQGSLSDRVRPVLAVVGLSTLAASLLLFNEEMKFPGFAAALPVLGAAALLSAGHSSDYPGRAALASMPMVAIGKVSYTLYLWHWPVFSFVDYALFAETETLRLALKLGLSITLTVATFHLIENPARRALNNPRRRGFVFVGFIACLCVMVPLGMEIRRDNYVNASVNQVADGGLVFPGPTGAPRVMLIGDSNASMYARMLRDLCRDKGFGLVAANVAAGDALPNPTGQDSSLWASTEALTRHLEPEFLIIANAWTRKLADERSRLDLALERLAPHAGRILILNQIPVLPPEGSRAAVRAGARPPFSETAKNAAAREEINAYLSGFESDQVRVLDVAKVFLNSEQHVSFIDARGRVLFHDATHLSGYGSEMVRPIVELALEGYSLGALSD